VGGCVAAGRNDPLDPSRSRFQLVPRAPITEVLPGDRVPVNGPFFGPAVLTGARASGALSVLGARGTVPDAVLVVPKGRGTDLTSYCTPANTA
jgi:hypothetical protein